MRCFDQGGFDSDFIGRVRMWLLLFVFKTVLLLTAAREASMEDKQDQYCDEKATHAVGECSGGGLYSDGIGELSSPYYPNNYDDNTYCAYLIVVSSDQLIKLEFTDFTTEYRFDHLYLYDGSTTSSHLISTYSGRYVPADVVSTSNALLLIFESDGVVTYSGFSVTYSAIGVTEQELAGCSLPVCGSLSSASLLGGQLTSHNHYGVNTYTTDVKSDCHLTLQTMAGGYDRIFINFIQVNLYTQDNDCTMSDKIVVTDSDGIQLGSFCDSPNQFTTSTGEMTITFDLYSNTTDYKDVEYSGFLAVYSLFYISDYCLRQSDYRCNNGRCISLSLVCDGYNHCGDNSDEHEDSCRPDHSSIPVAFFSGFGFLFFVLLFVGWKYSRSRSRGRTRNDTIMATVQQPAVGMRPIHGEDQHQIPPIHGYPPNHPPMSDQPYPMAPNHPPQSDQPYPMAPNHPPQSDQPYLAAQNPPPYNESMYQTDQSDIPTQPPPMYSDISGRSSYQTQNVDFPNGGFTDQFNLSSQTGEHGAPMDPVYDPAPPPSDVQDSSHPVYPPPPSDSANGAPVS